MLTIRILCEKSCSLNFSQGVTSRARLYCQVHAILLGPRDIASPMRHCQVHAILPGPRDIAKSTRYCLDQAILQVTCDIARFTRYCKIHAILADPRDIASSMRYCWFKGIFGPSDFARSLNIIASNDSIRKRSSIKIIFQVKIPVQ